jgi:hypothetical protein
LITRIINLPTFTNQSIRPKPYLGVEVLDLSVGEYTVDSTIGLELGAELGKESKALFLTGELEKIGTLAHDCSTASGHLEDLLFLGFPSDNMELLDLGLAQKATCKYYYRKNSCSVYL